MSSSDAAILVAFVGLASAILGGLLQAFAARLSDQRRFIRESKWELYSKFFLVLGELSFSDRKSERHINALSLMAQLRGRIGVIAPVDVVEAVGDVFRHSDLLSDAAQASMVRAMTAMRRDVGSGRGTVTKSAMVQLMFGSSAKEVVTFEPLGRRDDSTV